jgi:uncharacterized OsmC-like protein
MESTFDVTLTRDDGYRFRVDFGDGSGATLLLDEPEPLGEGAGPNAARVLAAAVGNCLSASLLFCLEKARVDVSALRTRVTGSIERNERGRLRLGALDVRIEPELGDAPPARIERCLEIFEDFCTVTASVRGGLEVEVEVAAPTLATAAGTPEVA